MRQKLIIFVLLFAVGFMIFDRASAWLYLPDPDSRAVVIYTTSRCIYCKQLRHFLKSQKIPYTEHDVEFSISGIMGFWALKGRGVPITVIGPEVIYGVDLETTRQYLSEAGYKLSTLTNQEKQNSLSLQAKE